MGDELPKVLSKYIPDSLKSPIQDGLEAVALLFDEFKNDEQNFDHDGDPNSAQVELLCKQLVELSIGYGFSVGFLPKRINLENELSWARKTLKDIDTYLRIESLRRHNNQSIGLSVESVSLSNEAKKQIRKLIEDIKNKLDDAELTYEKRNQLFKQLNAFLKAVDQENTSLGSILAAKLNISKSLGEDAEALEPFVGKFERVMKAIGMGSKDTLALPPAEEKKQIAAPPKKIEDLRDDLVENDGDEG